jgi:hypothetical protein
MVALLMAVAMFVATAGEAFGYKRVCPHHDAAARAAENPASEQGHAAHGRQEASAPASSHDGHGGPCDCLGNCTITVPPQSVPTGGVEVALPAPAVRSVIDPAAVAVVVSIHIDHLIPFANAPPLA